MAARHPKLDFLTRLRIRELVLMGLIALTALLANLPQEYVEQRLGVSSSAVVAVLAIMVIIGLFLYLKFFFFVAVVLLIAGANMPEQIADGLGVSKAPIIIALIALVGGGSGQPSGEALPDRPRGAARKRAARASGRCSTRSRRGTSSTRRRCCR
jgi:hypothetical protein